MNISEKQPHLPRSQSCPRFHESIVTKQLTTCCCFFTGKYVMVMGVITAVSPEPVIRAVKMADLSELSALHRRMWKLEVEELQQVLAWTQSCWWKTPPRRWQDDLLPSCGSSWVYAALKWFLTNGKKLPQRTGQRILLDVRLLTGRCDARVTKTEKTDLCLCIQYLCCEAWCLVSPLGSDSKEVRVSKRRSGAVGFMLPLKMICQRFGEKNNTQIWKCLVIVNLLYEVSCPILPLASSL